jgi:hypothetical protein
MSDPSAFISSCNQCISREDGAGLARLLALPVGASAASPAERALGAKVGAKGGGPSLVSMCESRVAGGLGAAVASRLGALGAIGASDWAEANKHANALYTSVLNNFREEDSSWLIPVVVTVSNDVRVLATDSDRRMHSRDDEFLREALRNLSNGFNAVAKVRGDFSEQGSKKLALFAVTNVLFKIYFKLNTLQLCSKLINVVERPGSCATDAFRCFPVSDVVTYKYYVGRLKMFEDRYEEARACFLFALRYTPKQQINNIRRILVNLIPVQMCLGTLPGAAVADRYGLGEFYQLGVAARQGNVRAFEEIMKTNQRRFIMLGVYLVLEQVYTISYHYIILVLCIIIIIL